MHAIKIIFLLAKMIKQKKIMAANFPKLAENMDRQHISLFLGKWKQNQQLSVWMVWRMVNVSGQMRKNVEF